MNYIDVIKAVWKWYQSSILEPNDYCLMMRLIAISNDDMGWENCFLRNNYELLGSTKLSFKQLTNSRNKLQQLGLISFNQRNGLPNVRYEIHFEPLLNLRKKSKAEGKVTQRFGKGEGIDKLNETKQDISFSAEADKKKNDDPLKNKKKKAQEAGSPETTSHWQELVEVWFDYNKNKFGDKPSFAGQDPRHFKKIIQILEKRAAERNVDWTMEIATNRLQAFLEQAFKDKWLSENFLLCHLNNFIDKIILKQNGNNTSHTITGSTKKATGGSIEELQALKQRYPEGTEQDFDTTGDAGDHEREEWAEAIVVN